MDDDAENGQGDDDQGHGNDGVQMQRGIEGESQVHGQHKEIAMREIDDLHHAPNEGKAQGDEGIDQAHEHPAGQDLHEVGHDGSG